VGMAMGGNAALALALRRPDLYCACVDLSGGIGCSVDTDFFIKGIKEIDFPRLRGAFGDPDKLRGSQYDIGHYARRNKEQNIPVPRFFIGVGKDDFIRDSVRVDWKALVKLGYDVTYEEAEGLGHDWEFWDMYMKKTFYEWLPLKRKAIYPE
jgi:putative tributyrin esterase